MKISIVIPVYNVSAYIERCLYSVFKQTYNEIEVLVVDDCGSDDSMEKIQQILSSASLREGMSVKVLVHEQNKGLSASRNTGINAATGEYVYFLDSDDAIAEDAIALLAAPISQKEYDFVIGNYTVFDSERRFPPLLLEGGEYYDHDIFESYVKLQWYMMAWNKLCKTSFLREQQLFFKEGLIHEDDLWSVCLSIKAKSMYVVQQPTYCYYIREGSITTTLNAEKEVRSYITIIEEFRTFQARNGLKKNLLDEWILCYYHHCLRWSRLQNKESQYSIYKKMRNADKRSFMEKFGSYTQKLSILSLCFHPLMPPFAGFVIYKLRCLIPI